MTTNTGVGGGETAEIDVDPERAVAPGEAGVIRFLRARVFAGNGG